MALRALQWGNVQHFWKQLAWTLGASVVLCALLMGLGVWMTPPWKVEPLDEHISLSSSNTAIEAKDIHTTTEGKYKVRETHRTLTVSGGRQVDAILREPIGAPGKLPAVQFIHGAGTGDATTNSDIAHALASAGIVTLVQSKRLDDYSMLHRDYEASATDYLTGINTLRSLPNVDANKVGIYAESEGTWITTLITKRDPSIAFTVLVSAPVFSARQQMAVGATEYLHIIGAPEGVEGIVPKMLSLNPGMLGLEYASFNAADYRNTLTMPLLVVYGTLDRSMPVEQGAQQLLQDANSVGNTNTMVRYYPTNHQIRLGSSLSKPGLPLPDQYTHDIESWVSAVAAGATAGDWTTPKIAGSQPFQQFAVPTDIRPGLITSFNVLVAMFVFIVLMWVVTVVLCIASHLGRKKRAHVSTDANGRTLMHRFTKQTQTLIVTNIVLAPIITLGFLAYFVFTAVSALNLQDHATALSIGWVGLRVATVISVALLCWLWVRMFFFYGPGRLDADEPEPEARMARGHCAIVACLSVCVLVALALGVFFNLIS